MLDFYKAYGCGLSGTCSKLLVKTGIPSGDVDLRTSHRPWVSKSLKHAACSWIGGAWYMIGVAGLLAPGLSSPGFRSFLQ